MPIHAKPTISGIDIISHDQYAEGIPHEKFRRLRDECPVCWHEEPAGNKGFWAITRYDDVVGVTRDYETFTSNLGIHLEEMDEEELAHRRSMIETDPPEHIRLRGIVNRGFSRRIIANYEDSFRQLASQIIDEVLEEEEFDFVQALSRQVPMRLLCRLLGVPDEDAMTLVAWGDAMIVNSDPDLTEAVVDKVNTDEFRLYPFRSPYAKKTFEYAANLANERRKDPKDDIVTTLLRTVPEGGPLTDVEFKNFFSLLMTAGNETTRHTINHGLLALMDNRAQMNELRVDHGLMDVAVDEILRWATPIMHFRRTATRDTEIRGVPVRKGDKVVFWHISANYDERKFDQPFEFDIRRQPNEHLSFGKGGPHSCLGSWLAKLEVKVVFEELLPRIRSIELTGKPKRMRSHFINGYKNIPVRVKRA